MHAFLSSFRRSLAACSAVALAAGIWLAGAREAWAGADWIGNSAVLINDTWYYDGNNLGWCTGGAFNGANLGSFSSSFTISGQLQVHASGNENWSSSSGDFFHYSIDGGTAVDINISKYSYENNNMFFQPGGSSCTKTTVDISALSAGQHTIAVWFGGIDGQWDSNNNANYVANFTVVTPEVWATGVDATSYLLNWSEIADAAGYDVQRVTSGESWPTAPSEWSEDFESGWTYPASWSAVTRTTNVNGNAYYLNAANLYKGSYGVEVRFDATGSYFQTPPLPGQVVEVVQGLRAGNSDYTTRLLALEASDDGNNWHTLKTGMYGLYKNTNYYTYTPLTSLPAGVRLRWKKADTTGNTVTLTDFRIVLAGNHPGHGDNQTDLTSGTTYEARVRKAQDGVWSDTLSVKAGVLPSSVASNAATTNTATFSWRGHADATGYRVDATTNLASEGWATQSLGQKTYTMNAFGSGDAWYYEGTQSTGAGGSLGTSPAWMTYATSSSCYGHHLGGNPGNALVSSNFPIAGANNITLQFTMGAWNLNITNTVGVENGRVRVFYRVDDGAWNYFGTALPTGIADGSTTNVSFAVPTGGLDGTNIAFKIEAPNATATNYPAASGTKLRFVGPFIREINATTTKILTRTAGASAGYYGTNSLSGYPQVVSAMSGSGTKTYTVGGLPPATPVYFRVQALQGSDTANPTARSVWVETEATTRPEQGVSWTAQPAGVTMGNTATVAAVATYENAGITYSCEAGTGSATINSATGVVTPTSAGTVTIRATANALAGKYPEAGPTISYTMTVRPAPPTTQATLAAGTRTESGFSLDVTRGGGSGVLVLVQAGSAPATPTDGVGVASRDAGSSALTATSYGDAYAVVNYAYADNSQHTKTVTGAAAGTHYYAAAFSYNHSGTVEAANNTYSYLTPGAACDFWTLATEPTTAATVSGAKAAEDGDKKAVITYNAGGAGNILLVMMPATGAAEPPAADGTSYAAAANTTYGTASAALGAGYVIFAGAAASGSQTVNVDGLSGGTSYVVYAFPYNVASGEEGGTSANYRAPTVSAAFTTEAAQGPENLTATTTRYTMTVGWDAMTPPDGKTITGYTVEATSCGGNGAVSTISTCPDQALASKYNTFVATHGPSDAWSYRMSVTNASVGSSNYPNYYNVAPIGHRLLGNWVTTTRKPAIESLTLDLSGAASARVNFQLRAYDTKNGYSSTYAGRSPITLYWSTNGGSNWVEGPKTGNGGNSFASTDLAVPADALVAGAKLQLRADSAAGFTYDNNGTTSYAAAGPVVKAVSVIQTAKATGDYSSSGCPVPAANIAVSGTTATITGLSRDQFYYYRVKANFSDGTSSHWTEASATTKGTMEAPEASASAQRYAGTVTWTAASGENANVTAWHVQVTSCTPGGADEPTTNSCPDAALSYATSPLEESWTYTNRANGYPSYQTWGGYNGGAHFLVGTTAGTVTPKGIVSSELNLSGMGSAYVRFMHAPNLQNPIARSYMTLYYSKDEGANWTKVQTLEDAGQVYPSLLYKELQIAVPDEALVEGVYLKLSADNAYMQVTDSATNQFGARIEGVAVVATPKRNDWDFSCQSTVSANFTSASSGWNAAGMSHLFSGLTNATSYGYQVWATDEGSGTSATNIGQFTTLAGQSPPVQILADPIRQTQMKLQWPAASASFAAVEVPNGANPAANGWYEASGESYVATSDTAPAEGKTYYTKSGTDASGYELQMTKCLDKEWERVVVTASPTNARLSAADDWSYIGGGTDVEAVAGVKASETTYITAGGIYPTWADGGSTPENSQVLAGEGEPGMMSAAFSTVGATNATITFNYGRWYAKESSVAEMAASVLTVSYSLDDGASWVEWFRTPSAYNYAYTYTGTYGTASENLPEAALGKENVRVKIVAENAGILAVSSGTHAVGAAVALAQVTLSGASGDYESNNCRVDDGTWTLPATAEELSLLVTNLEVSTPYYFRVRATDGVTDPVQYGAWTEGSAATLAAPEKVTNLVSSAIGRYAFTVSWDASARAEGYRVRVYSNAACTSLQGVYPETEALSQRVLGLAANTTYYVKVVAVADGVEWDDTTSCDTRSDAFTVTTASALSITGLKASDIGTNTMTISWEGAGSGANARNILRWGTIGTDATAASVEEVLSCPAETLKRTDSGNGWFYVGGSANYPAYWKGSTSGDEGHALIYASGGYPGIRSRWFDTLGATNVTVEFLHGRFNATANSTVELDYSLDGGATWTYVGETATSSATTPSDARSFTLPAAALGRKSVMLQLTAPGADGNKGAHVKDLKIRIQGAKLSQTGTQTWEGSACDTATSFALTGLAPQTRYWFALEATDDQTTWAYATNTAATYAETAGVLASQGFEQPPTDRTAWTYALSTNLVSTGAQVAGGTAGSPVVEVVENENPLYGRKALRLSGSAAANAFGVVDFTYALGNLGGVVTIPFSGKDLAKNDYLYVAYRWGEGPWVAPGGTNQTSMGGIPLTRIGVGGSDVLNQNWPYNRGLNATTRPKGDAYSFEVPAGNAGETLTVRVAFCGQTGGAKRYYYIDEVTLEEMAGVPSPANATPTEQGTVALAWTPPSGQNVIIIRGQDMREPPSTGAPDLSSLPEGYEVVKYNGTDLQWPNSVSSTTDTEATSGWRYYYYFYAVTASGTIGKTPAVAYTMVKGMVHAIASQGWDGWDVHPWGYKKGRVTNPGRSGDMGYWRDIGENTTTSYVKFFEGEYETDTSPERGASSGTYKEVTVGNQKFRYYWVTNYAAQFYAVPSDADNAAQLGVSSYTNYYGSQSFRLSGGGGTMYVGTKTYIDFDGSSVTTENPYINTNNAAIQFDNIDLTGYRNVEFQMHYAGALQGGGNYLHVAISTNGGAAGTWKAIDNLNSAGWRLRDQSLDYGLQLQTMSNELVGEKVDFYDQTLVQYGNPFILKVPDNVTQFMARVMFYDSNGRSQGWRYATYFIDEVRLLGEVAMPAPQPLIDNIASNGFRVTWTNVPEANRYNLKITGVATNGEAAVKLTEAFVVQGAENWTQSGTVTYPADANRQGGTGALGYGASLASDGDWLATPALGAVETLTFHAKAAAAGDSASLIVETKASGGSDSDWETLASYTASELTTSWGQKTIALPHRQWQQLRFRRSSSALGCNLYLDDITVSGSGHYAATGTLDAGGATATTGDFTTYQAVTNLTATNFTFTGLSSGTRYFVEVQAVKDVVDGENAYELASDWKSGETADYTAGHFEAEADGFVEPILIGNYKRIQEKLEQLGLKDRHFDLQPVDDSTNVVQFAIEMIKSGNADCLMRGNTSTRDFLMPVLNKGNHLVRSDRLVTHVAFLKIPAYERLLAVSDVTLLINPSADGRKEVLKNMVRALRVFDVEHPTSVGGISGSSITTATTQNIGSVRNRGVEVSFDVDIIKKRDFNWNFGVNATWMKNTILKLPEADITNYDGLQNAMRNGTKLYAEGHGLYDFHLYQYAGVDMTTGLALYEIDDQNYYILDENKIGDRWDEDSKQLVHDFEKSQVPERYRVVMLDKYWTGIPAGMTETSADRISTTATPRIDGYWNTYTNATSTRFLISGNYLIVKNVNLAYSFPKRWVNSIGLGGITLSASVDNLWTFTAKKGMNPQQAWSGLVYGSYVNTPRVSTVGVKVNF